MPFHGLVCKMVCLLVILFGGMNTLALAVGMQHPTHRALDGFTVGCAGRPQPCWYGIVPGLTTVEEGHQLVQWKVKAVESGTPASRLYVDLPGESEICGIVMETFSDRIIWLKIEYCGNISIQVGDVIAALGLPNRILGADREMGYGGVQTNSFGWWSPFDHTSIVGLVQTSDHSSILTWRGFIPKWRFCQIETGMSGC